MNKEKDKNSYKEIFFGLVGGVGVDFTPTVSRLRKEFENEQFEVHEIRLSDLLPYEGTADDNEMIRISKRMEQYTNLRNLTNNKSILALLSIIKINEIRKTNGKSKVYIIRSIKRPEEYDLFRKIYGRNFILISVHSSMEERKNNIKKLKSCRDVSNVDITIDGLIEKDFKETDKKQKKFGQNVSGTFPKAHLFLNNEKNLNKSIERFVDILFGYPFHTPTKDERNMFFARGISLRSADLSRQVGAVITDEEGDVIATGCNEVPKAGGGFYEPGDKNDKRDYTLGKDKNAIEKLKIAVDLMKGLQELGYIEFVNKKDEHNNESIEDIITNCEKFFKQLNDEKQTPTDESINKFYKELESIDLKVTDLLEYGRMVHAEMAAICDAARRGIKLKGKILYCTTYPCHMCAKLIIAVGIKRVIYIDPYPKSKVSELFCETIVHDICNSNNKCLDFEAFYGISPKRFLFLFKQEDRKKSKIDASECKRDSVKYLKGRNPINYLIRELCAIRWLENINNQHNFFSVERITSVREYLENDGRIEEHYESFIDDLS